MKDEQGIRAKRAAEIADDAAQARPKRFLTPDWDVDGEISTPDEPEGNAAPIRGGRFASDAEGHTELTSSVAAGARGRFSIDDAQGSDLSSSDSAQSILEPPRNARHSLGDSGLADGKGPNPGRLASTHEQDSPEKTDQASNGWRAIPVEPAPGASRAAQSSTLAEKRRREAPALPNTPQTISPAERREAGTRDKSGGSVAPGSVPGDDWSAAPLPASAVPPPAAGQAPTPIEVQEGDAPVAHRAYTRPSDESEDEDTVWLSRKPTSRAATSSTKNDPTPGSVSSSTSSTTSLSASAKDVPAKLTKPTSSRNTPAAATTSSSIPESKNKAKHGGVSKSAAEKGTRGIRPEPIGIRGLLRHRAFQIGAASLILVIALITAFLVWANRDTPSAASSRTAAALAEHLITPEDLSAAGLDQWTEQKTESMVSQDSLAPLCFAASPDLPTPTVQAQRKLGSAAATLLHRITSYSNAADASQVYAQRVAQLGQCSNIPVYLSNGIAVTSLGDEAVGITAVVQDTTPQYHTVILVRTGSMVLTYDTAQPSSALAFDRVLALAATTVKGVCSSAQGSCTASPTGVAGIPPNSSVPGWLTVSDLPRITTGMGRWNATSPKTTVTSEGSACENLTFATVAGPTQRRQRTYLLTEDTKVPKTFGLDEIIVDFNTADEASAFATQLKTSIADCPARIATSKLGNQGDIAVSGAKGQAVTGFWQTLTQSTNATTTFTFRVGVASVGTRVIYLLATPSPTFDFTDTDWAAITSRAGQRATQGD